MKKLNACLLLMFLCIAVFYGHTAHASRAYSLYNINKISYPKIVIVDINDTLIKSWWPTYELVTRCLIRLNHPRMSKEEIDSSPLVHIVDLLWSKTGEDLATIETIYQEELETLSKNGLPPIPIEGADELLNYLKEKLIPIIIISNDEKKILFKNLDKLGWAGFFKAIVTKNEAPDGINKPDPKIVEYAIKKAGLDKEDYILSSIWFIGDSYGDVKCAAGAGVVPIWAEDKSTAKFTFEDDAIKIVVAKNLHEIIGLLHNLEIKRNKVET